MSQIVNFGQIPVSLSANYVAPWGRRPAGGKGVGEAATFPRTNKKKPRLLAGFLLDALATPRASKLPRYRV